MQFLQNERDTLRVRRLVNNGMNSLGSAMMVMMLSLAQGADGSVTRRDNSVQTDSQWSMQVPQVAVTVLAIMIALLCIFKSLSLERLWANEVSMSTACDAEEPASAKADPAEFGRWSMCVAAIASAPSVLCLMFMMQLRKLKTLIEQERKENDRLQGVISEMDYDRIAWAEYHARETSSSSTSRPKSAASKPAAAVSEQDMRLTTSVCETHV